MKFPPSREFRSDWLSLGTCIGSSHLFFPDDQGDYINEDYAKSLCKTCKVQKICTDYGIRERFGIWGGLSENERLQLREEYDNDSFIESIDDVFNSLAEDYIFALEVLDEKSRVQALPKDGPKG